MNAWIVFLGMLLAQLSLAAIHRWVARDERFRFPELELIETDWLREATWLRAVRHSGRSITYFGIMAVFVLLMFPLDRVIPNWIKNTPGLREMLSFLWIGFGFLSASHGASAISRRRMNRTIRVAVASSGVPICLRCGYCAVGLPTKRCPNAVRKSKSGYAIPVQGADACHCTMVGSWPVGSCCCFWACRSEERLCGESPRASPDRRF